MTMDTSNFRAPQIGVSQVRLQAIEGQTYLGRQMYRRIQGDRTWEGYLNDRNVFIVMPIARIGSFRRPSEIVRTPSVKTNVQYVSNPFKKKKQKNGKN